MRRDRFHDDNVVLEDNVDDLALNVGKALPDQRRVDDLAVQGSELELRTTTDEAQIRAWWERWPDARVGVPTGPASGLFVLDADTDKKTCEPIGERNLLKLGFDVVAHPWKQRTQGGGWHVFFRWESGCRGNTVGKIADGVDTRSNGGYFIAYDLDAVLNLVEALHA